MFLFEVLSYRWSLYALSRWSRQTGQSPKANVTLKRHGIMKCIPACTHKIFIQVHKPWDLEFQFLLDQAHLVSLVNLVDPERDLQTTLT